MELSHDEEPIIREPFVPFLSEKKPDYRFEFRRVDKLPSYPEEICYENDCISVRRTEQGQKIRVFRNSGIDNQIYAVGEYDWEEHRAGIQYLSKGKQFFTELSNSFFHIAWENMLLREDRMILHSCCMNTKYGGILFSGRSGIGKSTQGNLWVKYENAEQINGDRPILRRTDREWLAYGSPYAGSSRCYVNKHVPVRAVVMLGQGKECRIRRLKVSEAFRRVYAQLTVNDWEPECVVKTTDLLMDLIGRVPVYELVCTPDQEAVETLKRELEEEGQ